MFPGAAIILAVVALIVPVFFMVMWFTAGYHRLAALRKNYQEAYARIDIQLKHRYDLIADLVETAKAYLAQEPGVLEAVAAACNAASPANVRAARMPGDPTAMSDLSGAESALAATLGRLLAVAQTDPDLNASVTMRSLVDELKRADRALSPAGQAYNDAVMAYNTVREMFPTNVIALPFSFGPAESVMFQRAQPQATDREITQSQ